MNIVDWAISVIGRLGGPGVALLIFLENVFPPIPSEAILPLAGVVAGQGEGTFWGMLLWSLLGSVGGALLLYGLGRALGPERLHRLVVRLPLIHESDYDRAVEWMEKHGPLGIFLGRFVPGIRSLISIPAGLFAMPLRIFLPLTALGSALWNALFIGLGVRLGENWEVIQPYTDLISNICYAIIAVLLITWVVRRILRDRRRRALGLPDPDHHANRRLDQRDAADPDGTEAAPQETPTETAGPGDGQRTGSEGSTRR
ncbi:DedA family protein [Brachybacterium sp. EF45031]|uniref:DedA family protein n=1 Tax=Brachybacterium sillae TaxID=2810536 RepID=UPI00217D42E6|nr:DedA family protein [Brachybacterium sillae]MCS6712155.1 DedA family protein [Brachybacterium sillae]